LDNRNFLKFFCRGGGPPQIQETRRARIALTSQCAYCIDVHTNRAREHGATKAELAETAFIAAAVRAGGTLAHSLMALRLFDEGSSSG
jgi:AhpD family alkylhydroperoxidase